MKNENSQIIELDGLQGPLNATPMPRARSKIAQLPSDARNYINQALTDGVTYAQIVEHLTEMGHSINEINISSWYRTGYQHHLAYQAQLDEFRISSEAALSFVAGLDDQSKAKLDESSTLIISSKISQALTGFDPQTLAALIQDKPEYFLKLASLSLGQANHNLARQKLQLRADSSRRRLNSVPNPSAGISTDSINKIQEALKLI